MKDTKISIFKDLFTSTDVPYIITLEKALHRIKIGKSKDRIEQIRNAKNKEEKSRLKKKLPSVVFGGEFTERKKQGLVNHSGLMIIDLDKYPDNKTMLKDMKALKDNPYIVSVFISPSGLGLKGLVRIPQCTAEEHTKYFKAFNKEFDYKYFDISNSNVDRVCFESYDPDVYINYDAKEYTPELIDEGYDVSERIPVVPITDEDRIIEKIMKFNWQSQFEDGTRNNFLFGVAGLFCEYGVSEYTAIGYITNNIAIGDFTDAEVERTIKSAYKRRQSGIKYFEDYNKIDKISYDIKNGKDYVIDKHKITEETFEEIKETKEHEDFWFFDKNGKVKVNPLKYKLFLERNGFKKHFPSGANKPTWVKIVSNKVSETSTEKIKDFVLDYLLNASEVDVWSYCANYQTLFSEQFLLMLETIELMMLKDTSEDSYLAFKNGILKVNKDSVSLMDYIDVDGYIWQSQILDRDFIKIQDNKNDYKTFIHNISGDNPEPIECVIGYLISTYKNKMNNKAIILNDEIISDNPEGGTGKGLFMQGVREVRRVSILDGKMFDDKKSFPYQTIAQDTNVLVFDDVKKNFDFESKFSLVTEGLTLERKNKDAIKLSVEDSPKIVISTNYAIKGEGNSHNRRRHEIEVSQYYTGDRTPLDEFGRQLFSDWDEEDYKRFDNYIIKCLQKYLNKGLIHQNAKNIKLRKFIAETSMEFYEWAEDRENLTLNNRNNKIESFESFIKEYKDFDRWLKRKKFNIWLKKYANLKDYAFTDGNSNGARWFQLDDGSEFNKILEDNENPF